MATLWAAYPGGGVVLPPVYYPGREGMDDRKGRGGGVIDTGQDMGRLKYFQGNYGTPHIDDVRRIPMTFGAGEFGDYGLGGRYNYKDLGRKRIRIPDQAVPVWAPSPNFDWRTANNQLEDPNNRPAVRPAVISYQPGDLVRRLFPEPEPMSMSIPVAGFNTGDPRLVVAPQPVLIENTPRVDPREYAQGVLKRVAEAETRLEDFAADLERRADAEKEDFMRINNSRASIMEGDGRVEVPDALDKLAGELRDAEVASRRMVRAIRPVGNGLGVGDIREAFTGDVLRDAMNTALPDDGMQVHTSEEALAATNQEAILDETERTELDKLNHPLSHEWVQGLPDIELDVKPAEACVRDCKERQRVKTLECKEVVRRVVAKLDEIGCRSIGTLNEEKVCGVCPGVET